MSTKTSFKRIALVAAAALALGGFSAVSANAANAGTATFTVTSATGTGTNTATKTVVTGTYVSAAITFTGTVDNVNTITSTGVGTILVPTIVAAVGIVSTTGITTTSATAYASEFATSVPGSSAAAFTLGDITGTVGTTVGALNISATSAVAGTQTITVTGSAGISTLVLTWGAAAAASPAASTVYYVETATPVETAIRANTYTADSTGAVINTAGTAAGVIRVLLNNDQAPAVGVDGGTISVSVSGVGLVKETAAGAYAQAATDTTADTGFAIFTVAGSGVSGAGTYTVTHTSALGVSTVLATKTVNFYGTTPTAATTVQNLSIGAAGGGALGVATTAANSGLTVASTPAVLLTLKDKNGFVVGGQEGKITAATSNALVLSKTVVVDEDNSASAANAEGAGYYIVQPTFAATAKTGDTATLTLTWTSTDGLTTVVAAPVTFTVGGSMSTGTVSSAFNQTDYAPGEALTLTFTAKDSKGNPVYDQDVTDLIVDAVVFNYATGIAQTAVNFSFIGGKASLTGYAPLAGGSVIAKATYDAGAPDLQEGDAISATASVTADGTASLALDAANAATDAANNAYDEAQNATQAASDALAAVTALAKQVKSLIASVKKLTAAVAKLK